MPQSWQKPLPPVTEDEVFAALRARNIIVRYFPGPLPGAYLRATIGTDPKWIRSSPRYGKFSVGIFIKLGDTLVSYPQFPESGRTDYLR